MAPLERFSTLKHHMVIFWWILAPGISLKISEPTCKYRNTSSQSFNEQQWGGVGGGMGEGHPFSSKYSPDKTIRKSLLLVAALHIKRRKMKRTDHAVQRKEGLILPSKATVSTIQLDVLP